MSSARPFRGNRQLEAGLTHESHVCRTEISTGPAVGICKRYRSPTGHASQPLGTIDDLPSGLILGQSREYGVIDRMPPDVDAALRQAMQLALGQHHARR